MATKKGKGSEGLDPKVAKKLLDLLSTDNEFRRSFKQDPHGALSSLGWKAPTGHKKAGPIARIAPKEQIARDRDVIYSKLSGSTLPFAWPNCLKDFSAK